MPEPYLFDTSAQSWLERSSDPAVRQWFAGYMQRHPVHVSAITVMERTRGFALLLLKQPTSQQRAEVELVRHHYLDSLGVVRAVDAAVAFRAAELSALLPQSPSSLKRSHRTQEVRQERLFRWRCDILIAATALVAGMPLVHHNPQDFETIRMTIETAPERFPTIGPLNLVNVIRLAQT